MTNTPIFDRILFDRAAELRSSLRSRAAATLAHQSIPFCDRLIQNSGMDAATIASEFAATQSEGILELADDGEFLAAIEECANLSDMTSGEILDDLCDTFLR